MSTRRPRATGAERPDRLQEECLLRRIVEPNRDCEYGRRHRFRSLRSVRDYQAAVPIVRYEDLRADVERMGRGESGVLVSEPVRHFFVTSGTTGAPKLVPVTSSLVRDKWRAFGIYWNHVFERHPRVKGAATVTSLAASDGLAMTRSGIPSSPESAFWLAWSAGLSMQPPVVPREVGAIRDATARAYATARVLVEKDLPLLMSLHPSTLLVLLRALSDFAPALIDDLENGGLGADVAIDDELRAKLSRRLSPDRARAADLRAARRRSAPHLVATEVWPSLSVVACWRSPMLRPYLRLLEPHVGPVAQRDYLCMASEGVISIPIGDVEDGPGGLLAVDTHFFEFVPEESLDRPAANVRLAGDLEVGRSYGVLLSTTAGLYRYDIGDVVRVCRIEDETPVVEFLHRAGATCSMSGEKLTEDQVVDAVSASADRVDAALESFTLFPAAEPYPHYVLLVERAPRDDGSLDDLPSTLDRELGRRNVEYAAKRESGRLGAPEVWITRAGGFAAWRARRVAEGAAVDQQKPIHLTRDGGVHASFEIRERLHAR
jgi:GH3 auxin-responsive promoter